MSATIKCNQAIKEEIKAILLDNLCSLMSSIEEDKDAVVINETEEGLEVEYPMGEIYGYTAPYVEHVSYIFSDLKNKYKDIEIYGIAYEYETYNPYTYGPLFYCKSSDQKLTITYEWQICANCGKIIEGDTFYNSSQKDYDEGTLACLCSPTCMLEYALTTDRGELDINKSFTQDHKEKIMQHDYEAVLRNMLFERIVNHADEYMNDFKENKQRIQNILEYRGLLTEQKAFLMELINKL